MACAARESLRRQEPRNSARDHPGANPVERDGASFLQYSLHLANAFLVPLFLPETARRQMRGSTTTPQVFRRVWPAAHTGERGKRPDSQDIPDPGRCRPARTTPFPNASRNTGPTARGSASAQPETLPSSRIGPAPLVPTLVAGHRPAQHGDPLPDLEISLGDLSFGPFLDEASSMGLEEGSQSQTILRVANAYCFCWFSKISIDNCRLKNQRDFSITTLVSRQRLRLPLP